MKNADPVMQDVWRAKEANAKKHQSLAAYAGAWQCAMKTKKPPISRSRHAIAVSQAVSASIGTSNRRASACVCRRFSSRLPDNTADTTL